jgi:hypothetical protein
LPGELEQVILEEYRGRQKLRWKVPRELLWAIIGALAITVISLWPTQYPYRQAPQIALQEQSQDAVIGREVTVLGIKPGEWLLGIVTWMLWVATVSLVKSADTNAERQLRAYIVAKAVDANMSGSDSAVMVTVKIVIKNTGQTPAHDLRIVSKTELLPHPIKMPFNFTLISGPDPSASLLGSNESIESESEPNEPFDGNAMMVAAEPESGARIYTWGTITYRDVFGNNQWTNFCSSLIFRESEYVAHASGHHNDAS